MNRKHLMAVLALSAGAAAAQVPAQPTTSAESVGPASPWRLVGQGGFSFGGDTLVSGNYSNGDSFSIKAGGGLLLAGGVEYSLHPDWSLQATVGWHWDSTEGSNGNIEFTRFPLELMGLYSLNPQWRVGLGVRSATGAKLKATGVARSFVSDTGFNSSPGAVFEVQYLFGDRPQTSERRGQMGLSARYVTEGFKPKPSGSEVKGDHLGLGVVFYY